jgi:hypothetical protein
VRFFAPLRYLNPAQFEAVVREGEQDFRKLWQELPWSDR